ncbi:MAG: hypothetical protein P1U56_01175 [Saprospiraceae bacterium]|nr:hypothetical protein [Saprospiraceae bacterium]
MEDRIKEFLESGKLEEYVYGTIDSNDREEVESYINRFPEVQKEYIELQDQLESISKQQAIRAPIGMKSAILDSLPDKKANTTSSTKSFSLASYIAAASIIAGCLFAWNWKSMFDQLKVERDNYSVLATECDERDKKIQDQNQLIAFLNSEQTQRFEMQGNELAPDFKALIFVNSVFGKAILKAIDSPSIPADKCLQLWGDLDGEMIPIAVLDQNNIQDINLDINPAFTSLNLTIEKRTEDGKGQLHPDVSQLISSVLI